MKRNTLETMRQTRLLITKVVFPVIAIALTVDLNYPELKYQAANRIKEWSKKQKERIINAFTFGGEDL